MMTYPVGYAEKRDFNILNGKHSRFVVIVVRERIPDGVDGQASQVLGPGLRIQVPFECRVTPATGGAILIG